METVNGGTKAPNSYKLARDPAVTRVGRFLRQWSLDELPQLINVIKGDMSLVGPRPPITYEIAHYAEHHLQRLAVPGGITGLWQTSGRAALTFEEMVALDLEYIETRTFLGDVWILLKTVPTVLSREGAG
jgi:lipopolysaccharide/colanic/teichoic acid biosynthesis glycosyltransferase